MSSLADAPNLVGFFSYSREDDEGSGGKLSKLRERIQEELRLQLGRSWRDFRLWQDKAAIPRGELWRDTIKKGISESVFFIPIITPTAVKSPYCKFEFESFLARERELDRNNLIFPILYVPVPALTDDRWHQDSLLAIVGSRQYEKWQDLRHLDASSTEVAQRVEKFCADICRALKQEWLSPEERREAEARRVAEAERRRQEKLQEEARQRAEEERRRQEAEIKQRAEEQERRRKAEAEERRRDEDERRRQEKAEAEERRRDEAERRRQKPDYDAPQGTERGRNSMAGEPRWDSARHAEKFEDLLRRAGGLEDRLRRSPPVKSAPIDTTLPKATTRRTPALDLPRMKDMRGSADVHPVKAESTGADLVDFSIFAPSTVMTDSEIFVQVMLHLAEELTIARTRAAEIDDTAVYRGTSTLQAPIAKGSSVTVTLAADEAALAIERPAQSVRWAGHLVAVNFLVKTRGIGKPIFPVVRIGSDGAIVGELRFRLNVTASREDASASESTLQETECKRYQRVFFSYASQDRARVLEIAQSYRVLGVSFFQDILNLEPGQRWEQGLYKEIDACDLFLLFWSYVSSHSEWVEKEARYALERQTLSAHRTPDIVPFILDGPPPPDVPAFLSHLHFDDWMRYAIEASKAKPWGRTFLGAVLSLSRRLAGRMLRTP